MKIDIFLKELGLSINIVIIVLLLFIVYYLHNMKYNLGL